jgi:hypothetical protein
MPREANIGLRAGAPLTIHNGEDLAKYTSALSALTQKESTAPEEDEAIERLTQQIEQYEHSHFPVSLAG